MAARLLLADRLRPIGMHRYLSVARKAIGVRCMYHGLKYDQLGRCVEILAKIAVPARLQVKRYPLAERGRWIFVWMGQPDKVDTALLPDVSALHHPDWRMKPGYMHYNANYLVISDNLLDFFSSFVRS